MRALSTNDFDEALETIRNSARAVADELRITALKSNILTTPVERGILLSADVCLAQTEEIREQDRYRTGTTSRHIFA